MMDVDESKKFVFRNRQSVLEKLGRTDVHLVTHPEGKLDRWHGDPALIFSKPIRNVRFSGKKIDIIGVCLFTSTSKMGAGSISLSAGPVALGGSCPASKLPEVAEGAWEDQICRKCYALKNNFSYELPQLYQAARYRWIKENIRNKGVEGTARLLASAVKAYNGNLKARKDAGENPAFFRVHDSGDLFEPDYWKVWQRVFDLCAPIRFWIPTRMHWIPGWRPALAAYRNKRVVMRPSAYHFNDVAPNVPGLAAGTTGHYPSWGDPQESGIADFICPAYAAEGACINAIRLAQSVYRGIKPGYGERSNPKHGPIRVSTREQVMLQEYRRSLTPTEREITNDGWDCRVCWIRPQWSVSYKVH